MSEGGTDDDGQFRRSEEERVRRRSEFLTEWTAATSSFDADARLREEGAIGFAQAALKSAFVLNGGAFVAIPTLAALFKIDGAVAKSDLSIALIVFAGGLLATWLATAAAYFTMVYQHKGTQEARAAAGGDLEEIYYPNREKSTDHKAPAEWRRHHGASTRFAETFRQSGIVLSFLSFAAFLAGGYFGAKVMLTETKPTAAEKRSLDHPGSAK